MSPGYECWGISALVQLKAAGTNHQNICCLGRNIRAGSPDCKSFCGSLQTERGVQGTGGRFLILRTRSAHQFFFAGKRPQKSAMVRTSLPPSLHVRSGRWVCLHGGPLKPIPVRPPSPLCRVACENGRAALPGAVRRGSRMPLLPKDSISLPPHDKTSTTRHK